MMDRPFRKPEHESNHQVLHELLHRHHQTLVSLHERAHRLQVRGQRQCPDSHHVPVALLLGEPEGQRASPTAGHRGNAVRVDGARGEPHQAAAAGSHRGLQEETQVWL